MIFLFALASLAVADVYMQNPRGSNDRLKGGNQDRDNENRLFNSQNNARGGYAINTFTDMMSFYEGSWMTIEWTSQHGCGHENNDCTIILQYMCGSKDEGPETLIRDGTNENTITIATYNEKDETNPKKFKYGAHESLDYHRKCEARDRNYGLYLADRNLNGNTAQFTRQSNAGTRYGFECAEERDYYPYWHPTPWRDIAVLTNDVRRCQWYKENSQNVMDKGHCEHPNESAKIEDKQLAWKYNNETACAAANFQWIIDGNWNMAAPDCKQAPWSRDNHLGNGITDTLAGQMNHYNWSMPTSLNEPCIKTDSCVCVLRLRYNSSTLDFQGFGDKNGYGTFVDASFNGKGEKAPITGNPVTAVTGKSVIHALNTNQYARTFQDRSHAFGLKSRPAGLENVRIFNLNVRGKRGNIVQTYPAVEYDFVPQDLVVRALDYIHVQWVGFDNNPNNGGNNAEGFDGSDRSNICQIKNKGANVCLCDTDLCLAAAGVKPLFESASDREKMAYVGQDDEKDCDTMDVLKQRHNNDQNKIDNDKRNCYVLNAADALFDGGLIRVNQTGKFDYMSSRNNNFSNRSQKASIVVLPVLSTWAIAVVSVGAVLLVGGLVTAALVIHGKRNPSFALNAMFDKI